MLKAIFSTSALIFAGSMIAIIAIPVVLAFAITSENKGTDAVKIAGFVAETPEKSRKSAGTRGVSSAWEAATPLLSFGYDAGKQGVALGEALSTDVLAYTGDFGDELALVSSLTALAAIEPWQAMANAADRAKRFAEIEETIASELTAAEEKYERLAILRAQYQAQANALNTEKEMEERAYFNALNSNRADLADRYYQRFTDTQAEWNLARGELGRVNAILTRLQRPVPAVRRKLAVMQQNREALVAGIQVDARSARAAGVVK